MNRGDHWMGSSRVADGWRDSLRAGLVARMIADEHTFDIVVQRDGVDDLPPQRVRLDYMTRRPTVEVSQNRVGSLAALDVIVLGYRNHPEIADTNLKRGDIFVWEGQKYDVTQVFNIFDDRLAAVAMVRS